MVSASLKGVIAQNLLKTVDGNRNAAFKILVNSSAVANLIREGKAHQIRSSMQTRKQDGMTTMDDSLRALVCSRRVSMEEALKFATRAFLAHSPSRSLTGRE